MRPNKSLIALATVLSLGAIPPALGPALGAETALRGADTQNSAMPTPVERPDRNMAAEREFLGAKVVSTDNKVAGEVEEIVWKDDAPTAVIRYGGLLGLGDSRVSLPLADLEMVASGIARVRISDAQVKRLPRYEG